MISIEHTLCQECPRDIDAQMEIAFPIWKTKKEWPGDHQIWKKFHEIRRTFEQKCFHVIGPDGADAASLCAKHLQIWLDKMKSPGAL